MAVARAAPCVVTRHPAKINPSLAGALIRHPLLPSFLPLSRETETDVRVNTWLLRQRCRRRRRRRIGRVTSRIRRSERQFGESRNEATGGKTPRRADHVDHANSLLRNFSLYPASLPAFRVSSANSWLADRYSPAGRSNARTSCPVLLEIKTTEVGLAMSGLSSRRTRTAIRTY